jgi:hypothetical protein
MQVLFEKNNAQKWYFIFVHNAENYIRNILTIRRGYRLLAATNLG